MEEWQKIMLKIPNIPSVDTPEGPDESGNQVIRSWGEKPQFSFKPKEHFELGKALGIIDTETAAEVAGSRYCLSQRRFGSNAICSYSDVFGNFNQ